MPKSESLALAFVVVLLGGACSETSVNQATGGTTATGGLSGGGGTTATGGVSGGGGATATGGVAGSDASVVVSCPAGGLQDLKDDFSGLDIDPGKWEPWATGTATFEQSGGKLSLEAHAPSDSSGIISRAQYATSGCRAWVEVPQVNGSGIEAGTRFTLFDGDNEVGFAANYAGYGTAVELAMLVITAGGQPDETTIGYDPSAHRFWALRFTEDQVAFETSPDAKSWTVRREMERPSWLDKVKIELGADMWSSTNAGTATATFDNLNVVP